MPIRSSPQLLPPEEREAREGPSSSAIPAEFRVMEQSRWFSSLSLPLKQEIIRHGRVRRYAANTLVYYAGSPPSGFYAVLEGEIGLEHMARSGKFAFYHTHGEGEVFGVLSVIDGSPRFSDARALGDSTLLHVSQDGCHQLMQKFPAMREAFVAFICENLHTTLMMMAEHHSAPPKAQIANILVSIFSRKEDDLRALPKLTHESMAAMAGVSRQTVAKVLHEFKMQGLIDMQYSKIRVRDLERLQEAARD